MYLRLVTVVVNDLESAWRIAGSVESILDALGDKCIDHDEKPFDLPEVRKTLNLINTDEIVERAKKILLPDCEEEEDDADDEELVVLMRATLSSMNNYKAAIDAIENGKFQTAAQLIRLVIEDINEIGYYSYDY